MIIKKILLLFFIALVFGSCASNKNIIYLQEAENSSANKNELLKYENILQPDDNLIISILSDEPELANDFNLIYLTARGNALQNLNVNEMLYTYLIDQNGEIDFPVLGKIKLAGLTRIEAQDKIKKLLANYIKNPGVILRVTNFKVSVIGEVPRSGIQNVSGDRITLFEALSSAGDMTIYGKRKGVTIIREIDGIKTISEVDITNVDFINSPYYYLAHNDVVYVKPNKTRVNSSVVGPNITVGISAISLIITIIALSTR